jgi:chromosome segregation ATPase
MNCRTPGEWHSHANSNMSMAYSTQVKALKQMDSSKKAHQECLNDNMSQYYDLHASLEQKVHMSHRLVEKLSNRTKSVEMSIANTKQSHAQLLQALRAKDPPLSLCAWRMEQREKRPLREHVRDHVEMALEEERNTLVDTQRKLNDACKMTLSMISLLEGKRDELKHDIDQKSQALTVDELCLRTTHRSWHSQVPSASAPNSPRTSTGGRLPSARRTGATATAEESNRNEVARQQVARRLNHSAQSREEAASELREDNHRLIQRCEKMALEAAGKTERALQDRVNEIQQMRRRLESEARETKKKEESTKNTISETRSQIQSLEEPMALCSTHSSWRKQRACREQILDPVETRLEEQKRKLMATTEELRNHRQQEHSILTELQQHMERLREDLKDKTAALNIDLNCLTHVSEAGSPNLADPSSRARYSSLMKKMSSPGGSAIRSPRG